MREKPDFLFRKNELRAEMHNRMAYMEREVVKKETDK